MKVIAKQAFEGNARQYIQTFSFEKLTNSIQQDLLNSNEEAVSFEEIKTCQNTRQHSKQFTQVALHQPFYQETTMENDEKPKTTPQPQNAIQMKSQTNEQIFQQWLQK